MNLYESFAQATQLGDLHTCLMMDMKACQEDDVRLLCHLTPSIYTEVSVSGGIPLGRGSCAGRAHETVHLRIQPLLAAAGCFFQYHTCPPPPCPLKVKKCLKPPEFLSCALWCELGSERLHLGSQLWPHPLDPGQAPSQTRVHTLQALLPSDGSPSVSVVVPENQGLCGGDSAFVSLVHSLSSLGTGTSEEYQLFILLVRVPGNREIRAPGVGTTGGTVISAKICRGRGAHAQFPPLLPPW